MLGDILDSKIMGGETIIFQWSPLANPDQMILVRIRSKNERKLMSLKKLTRMLENSLFFKNKDNKANTRFKPRY